MELLGVVSSCLTHVMSCTAPVHRRHRTLDCTVDGFADRRGLIFVRTFAGSGNERFASNCSTGSIAFPDVRMATFILHQSFVCQVVSVALLAQRHANYCYRQAAARCGDLVIWRSTSSTRRWFYAFTRWRHVSPGQILVLIFAERNKTLVRFCRQFIHDGLSRISAKYLVPHDLAWNRPLLFADLAKRHRIIN